MHQRYFCAAAVPFEAACRIELFPEGHRSHRLHGHSYLTRVRASLPEAWADFPGAEVGQLRDRLAACVAPLDYSYLNDHLPQPTDENLARWVRARLGVPGIESVGVQCTAHEGVDLDANDHAHIWRRYRFEAAHYLPNVPPQHKCGRMHGHGFEVIIHANQDIGSRDIGIDYDYLDSLWEPIFRQLQHTCLNDIPGLENPTSELMASWLWQQLKPRLAELSWVTVYETASCGAQYDGTHYRIWRECSFDSALQLKRAPPQEPRRRTHGHTYNLRLHLSAPLDAVQGWAMDFGDVKEIFSPLFDMLDHRPLHELPGLEDNDTHTLADFIRRQSMDMIPALDRIDLFETRGCGTILSWGKQGPSLPI